MQRQFKYPWVYPTIVFAIILGLSINTHKLWGDEAETALFAQNTLRCGVPCGWDEANIMGLRDGVVLNEALINSVSPWAQYYLTAASFAIFGPSTTSARLPFALISLLTIPLTYAVARKSVKRENVAVASCWLLTLSTVYILFAYQARYYALSALSTLLLSYAWLAAVRGQATIKLFSLAAILLFYSHYLAFFALLLAIISTGVLSTSGRRALLQLLPGLVVTLFVTLPWFFLFGTNPQRDSILPNTQLGNLIELSWRYLVDFNTIGALPMGILPLLIFIIVGKKQSFGRGALSLVGLCLMYIVWLAFLSPQPLRLTIWSDIRYAMNIFPLLIIVCAVVLTTLIGRQAIVGKLILGLFLLTNVLSFPLKARSYLWEYLYELSHPYLTATDVAVEYLSKEARDRQTAFVSPDQFHEPLQFFVKKKLLFINRLSKTNPIVVKNRQLLPSYLYNATEPPDWIILFGRNTRQFGSRVFSGPLKLEEYQATAFPIYAQDETRPELFLHSFKLRKEYHPIDSLLILRRLPK